MDLEVFIIETVSITEYCFSLKSPCFYQEIQGLEAGSKYRLSFQTSISAGFLEVFQGTSLVFSSNSLRITPAQTLESTVINEKIMASIKTSYSHSDAVIIEESIAISIA